MPYAPGRRRIARPPQAPAQARYIAQKIALEAMRNARFARASVHGVGVPWAHGTSVPLMGLKLLVDTYYAHGEADDAAFLAVMGRKR